MKNEYKSYSLFNDVEDAELRNRNRAVVLANIAQDSTKNRLISPGGAGTILGYFNQLSNEDKPLVQELFVKRMKEQGFAITK